jgi:hypothetical protein
MKIDQFPKNETEVRAFIPGGLVRTWRKEPGALWWTHHNEKGVEPISVTELLSDKWVILMEVPR